MKYTFAVLLALTAGTAYAQPAPRPTQPAQPAQPAPTTQPAQPAPTTQPAQPATTAQPELPPPPPPPDPEEEHRLVDAASELIAQGRAAEAQRLLDAAPLTAMAPQYSALPVLSRLAGRLVLRPSPLTVDEPAPPSESARSMRSGVERFELYAMGFTYGVGTGIVADILFDLDEIRSAVWIPIALGGAGIGAAYLLDRGDGFRRGRASSANTGMLLGAWAGLALGGTLDEFNDAGRLDCLPSGPGLPTPPCTYSPSLSARARSAMTWVGATVGLGAGLGLAVLTDATPASASFTFAGGLWGAGLGLLTVAAINSNDDFPWLGSLVGEAVGAGLAAVGARYLRPTEAQVRWTHLGVLAGGLLGLGIGILPDSNTPAVIAVPVQLGMVGGGIAGYLLGAPSRPEARRAMGTRDRFRGDPSIVPVQGGAVVGVNFPNLL